MRSHLRKSLILRVGIAAFYLAGGWAEVYAAQFDVLAAGILAMHRGNPAPTPPSPQPTPNPTPTPAGQCENCHGTGRLGDGTVSVTCPVCNGTGRKVGAVAAAANPPAPAPAAAAFTAKSPPLTIVHPQAPALGGRWVADCANGRCSAIRWEPDPTSRPARYGTPPAAEYQMDCSSGSCQMRRVR